MTEQDQRASAMASDTVLSTPARNQWWDVWDQYKTHTGALIGTFIFVFIVLAVLIGPFLWTIDPTYIDIRARNSGLSLTHPFGTDQLGRDTLARVLAGGRISLAVGMTAMALALIVGTFIGLMAGYFRKLGQLDEFSRSYDCLRWNSTDPSIYQGVN